MCGPVEADPEYQLIVESNNMLLDVETEISMCNVDTSVSLQFTYTLISAFVFHKFMSCQCYRTVCFHSKYAR